MTESAGHVTKEYVTASIAGQLFGLPILRVQDVFIPDRITRVPLAPPEVAGLLNLRGRIVTLIDMRRRLGLAVRTDEAPPMAIGVDLHGESYGLLIDSVDEVLKLDAAGCEPNPANLDERLAGVSSGIYRLESPSLPFPTSAGEKGGGLLVVLDVDRVLDLGVRAIAA